MTSTYHRNRFLLACGALVAATVFWFAGQWFHIPRDRGFNISVLAQPSPIATLLIIAIAVCACVVLCTLIAGSVRADAGLFCTALGLMALSARGGSIRHTLFEARGAVFFSLTIELLLLFAIFVAGWFIITTMSSAGLTRSDDADFAHEPLSLDQKILTTAIQAVATSTLVLILCRTDQKAQCLASVGIASLLGSMLAVMSSPTRPSVWFWTGPLLVGLLGYIWASIWGWQDVTIGQVSGYLSALARPLPLDYASAGIAGSMLGYWFGRSWAAASEASEASEPSAQTA